MQKKRTGRMLCSLALSAVTLWGVSVTAPAKDARDALRTLKDETLGVMLLRYERGDGGEDFLSLRTSLALHATPLLREGEENIAQAWSAELEQKPDDSADETGDAQDNEGTVLTQEETPDEIAVTENGSPARTLKASDPSGYTVFGNVYINNGSDAALDASMLAGDYAAKLSAEGPQVLIIHTHGSESYTMPPGQEYNVSDTFRTLDTNCNMIRIGDEMAQVLTDAGISVVHDRSLYDYPSYSGAYNRSLASIESYLQKYPSISFVLDVHRDAVQDANGQQFKLLNESFRETFLELFGGGKAQLELEDENDILSCGIEIKVQPPGKQLKTITLLSGGEKAFVAIALYFAILKVHPTPFCVMDEIEAALDEANVVRYARYMRRIAGRTQFIVITHRRGTMEEADVLYGVTMQEKGVSRILTINLNDMAKELHIQ